MKVIAHPTRPGWGEVGPLFLQIFVEIVRRYGIRDANNNPVAPELQPDIVQVAVSAIAIAAAIDGNEDYSFIGENR